MRNPKGKVQTAISSLFLSVALFLSPLVALAQDKFPIAVFPFPSVTNIYADLIIAKEFDKANGFKVEPITYGTGGAMWAGLAKGEIAVHNMSPYLLQKMRADKIPLQMFSTFLGMGWIVVTKNPEVKQFADLKGRTIAATVAFSEYDYLEIYAKKRGISFKDKDINVVDATTSLAQAQLEAGRVDGILTWDPSATMILTKNPDARTILHGVEAWKYVSGDRGWDLGLVVRTDYLKKNPGALRRIFKMYQDAANFAQSNPDEADAIVTSGKYINKGIPPGTISTGIRANRLILDVRPTWDRTVNAEIWKMLKVGLDGGHIPALPDKDAVVSVAPK